MIIAVVVNRTPPSLLVTFNRSVTLSEFAHVSIKVVEIPLAAPLWSTSVGEVANDKPASMWVCPLDNVVIESEVQVELSCDPQHVTFVLKPGYYLVINSNSILFIVTCYAAFCRQPRCILAFNCL